MRTKAEWRVREVIVGSVVMTVREGGNEGGREGGRERERERER